MAAEAFGGATILTGSIDGMARLWDGRTGDPRHILSGHEDAVTSVTFAPDGVTVLTGSRDGTVRRWNSEMGDGLRDAFDPRLAD